MARRAPCLPFLGCEAFHLPSFLLLARGNSREKSLLVLALLFWLNSNLAGVQIKCEV